MGIIERIVDKIVVSSIDRNSDAIKDLVEQEQLPPSVQDIHSDSAEFSKKILINDFQECMGMLRYYDSVNWDVTKFAFGQVMVVIGACWSILNFAKNDNQDILDVLSSNSGTRYIIALLLLFSALFVLLSILVIVKNRTYFVKMSRYLNECRDYAIQNNVIGFDNKSNMWHDYNYPKIIDWFSTQMLCFYLLVLLFMILSSCSLGIIIQYC
jgi:hypothetical protein